MTAALLSPASVSIPLDFNVAAAIDANSPLVARKAAAEAMQADQKVAEWELAELSAQAESHRRRILANETQAALDYWLLGGVLGRVRANFPRGTWQPWLDRRGIDRTRAKRARQLAAAFNSQEKLNGLTVHAALKLAKRMKQQATCYLLFRRAERRAFAIGVAPLPVLNG